jgi:predicted MPP superfamily phosphohydrolase|tara:strand:- start:553 stop:1788 length:1236 start_codon:yes stop_codon:yes gene_type:complete
MERFVFLFVFTLISVFLDVYFYQIIKKYRKIKWTKFLFILYWSFTFITIVNFLTYYLGIETEYYFRTILFNFVIGNFISKVVALPFILIDDLRRLMIKLYYLFWRVNGTKKLNENKISRSKFLSLSASIAYGFPMASLTYGIISNNIYDYRIRKKNIILERLPKKFDGIKVCQISDIHIGSLRNRKAAMGGIQMIINEKPDIIFFTGDLVNDRADELKNWGDTLSKIKAPLGVHSILGNHDYGEYTSWENGDKKSNNFNNILKAHKEFGWNLMMNENDKIIVDNESINLIGVENWSLRFKTYGDLSKAYRGLDKDEFKLLLTHNPSHWNQEVIKNYKDIDLTLSGHTHGLQYGIEVGDFRWSPSKLAYDQWADLYKIKDQYIYVNRGFGFLGYQGRVGILPEITILNLKSS